MSSFTYINFKSKLMKTILYATDYSQQSISGLKFAHSLALKLKAQLIALHVFDIPISLASPVTVSYMKREKRLFVEHRVKLENFCADHLGEQIKKLKPIIVVDEDGSVISGIQEKALRANADLIVVGKKGASKTKEFFLGSTPKGLYNKTSCPVLTIPTGATTEHLSNIVYASDFEQSDVFAIRKLTKIAEAFDATIKVIHITTKEEYAGDQQMEWFKELLQENVDYSKIEFNLIYSETIFEDLQKFLVEAKADVLAMLERSEEIAIKRFFHRDLVKRMHNDIDIPLLSYTVGAL